VAVAVVGGAVVAGVGLATQGSPKPRRVLQVDEKTGRIGRVVLGETRQNVLGTLGQPREVGYAPSEALVYPRLTVGLRDARVVSIETDDPAARTNQAVGIGEPISAARASYRKAADCVPSSPDKTAKHPQCKIKVPAGWLLVTGDPIKTLALSTTS
jgi:hypothetical protein